MNPVLDSLHEVQGELTTEIDDELWLAQFDALADCGYVIIENFLPNHEAAALYHYAAGLSEADWNIAGIGREQQHTLNTRVRSDQIRWLHSEVAAEAIYLNTLNNLRVRLNRRLFMGLFDYECHLARYQPGAFYKKHLDAFKGRSNRVLTTVFYLNPEWHAEDGGELVIYGTNDEILETVLPKQNTLVVFLSDTFVHEVKTAYRERFSITGWFRHNASDAHRVDPPA
ncbi:proline hydroxylase [Aliidiomarina iranensis]|uniref:Proline hydroxylase n=1 Tax=Aliidiomarina iranensis TaxID=1434071 RepID=A0A432W2B5_9GAMM|nr:2OG-Fe(II) oxygenase [Aliidiomarina iranensis]RUO23367.1 proline hydroxylase [Aliidiomarina iranensis]